MRLLFPIMFGMCICISSIQAIQVIESENYKGKLSEKLGKRLGKSIGQVMSKAREKAILDEILEGYEPSKNSIFVLKILQSELSQCTKEMIVNALNEQHKMYLYERAIK